jgi:3-methyladenine DNA glycosylase/8-oxoguanine DNA glycosylase
VAPTRGRDCLEVEVRPPWPFRLPARNGPDGVLRARRGVVTRLLHIHDTPVVVDAWRRPDRTVVLRAAAAAGAAAPAARDLEVAIERMRFALGVDDDLSDFYGRFRSDRLLGPAVRARPWHRPRRRPWPWEALAWAVTNQLIESGRAAAIQRRIVRRWGPFLAGPGRGLRDVPGPAAVAARAPAELAAADLAPSRALALIRCAREVAAGRVDPGDPGGDRRLLRIREIGPWTVQCLGLFGRGDADALPAGDLGYLKVVGRLLGMGRRATIPEVEEMLAPYAPFRGLAGSFILAHYHRLVPAGPPLRFAT